MLKDYKDKDIEISFVFPCLNEHETIAFCIEEAQSVLGKMVGELRNNYF